MKDVFNSIEKNLCETLKQNEHLNEQLLEAKIKHEIKCCVLLSHECVDNSMQDEIEKIQRESIEIQERMKKRINIPENDVQRCQKQSLDFELQFQHEKERRKCESSLKNICETSWISKMEKLERLRAISRVRRPSIRDSSFKNSVLSNTKNSSEKVEVYDRTTKSKFEDHTLVVSKTRFSVQTVQSKSLDSTPVVSKTKIAAVTPLSAKHKVSSAFKLRACSLSNYM
ncbi:hypothetical protein Tco_1508490 [Tanacetum coccineum]